MAESGCVPIKLYLLLVGAPRTLTVSCHRRWQGEKLVSVSSAAGAPGSPPPRRLLAALTSLSGELHQVQCGPYRRPSDKPEVLAWGPPETRVRHLVRDVESACLGYDTEVPNPGHRPALGPKTPHYYSRHKGICGDGLMFPSEGTTAVELW